MPFDRYPKEIVLKDHKEIILRPIEEGDQAKLVQFYQGLLVSFRWFLKEDPCDPEIIKKWINNHKQGKAFSLLALNQDRIAANAVLLTRSYGGSKHVGRLRVILLPDFEGKQLGNWMIFDLTKRAMEKGLEKLRADFVVGVEDKTIEAFENLYFVKEGLLTNFVQDEEGNYYDYQIMTKQINNRFSDF
ncbi:MAG: hypothetical protein HQ517_06805 [SAR324 cluster bacterium]|nr:hypothetical protein [SAR324 cluster bacterium]